MPNLPARTNGSSISRADRIRRLFRKGWTTQMIVEKLAKDDPKKTRHIEMQIGRILVQDEELQADLAAMGHASLIEGVPDISKAVVRRAVKGNIPAAKLAYEASGFHNPRVKHEHTGDIKVTIDNAPRPPVVEDDVVDGTVVE